MLPADEVIWVWHPNEVVGRRIERPISTPFHVNRVGFKQLFGTKLSKVWSVICLGLGHKLLCPIDLLGIDKDANLVVIELKVTEDGGHMELQAIRYAAMVSAMTFDRAVSAYGDYVGRVGQNVVARESILDFLGWDEPLRAVPSHRVGIHQIVLYVRRLEHLSAGVGIHQVWYHHLP